MYIRGRDGGSGSAVADISRGSEFHVNVPTYILYTYGCVHERERREREREKERRIEWLLVTPATILNSQFELSRRSCASTSVHFESHFSFLFFPFSV